MTYNEILKKSCLGASMVEYLLEQADFILFNDPISDTLNSDDADECVRALVRILKYARMESK